MIVLKTKELEKRLGKLIRKNITVLGIDTASRTGWCRIKIAKDETEIDYGFIDIDSKDRYFKYNTMIDTFPTIIKGCDKVVIEDVFMKFNVMIHAMLSRIGMIVYVLAHQQGIKEKEFIGPSSVRKQIGLNGTAKKEDMHKEFKEKFKIDIDDKDIIDSIVLAIYGCLL